MTTDVIVALWFAFALGVVVGVHGGWTLHSVWRGER